MKKRIFKSMLLSGLVLSALTACGTSESSSSTTSDESNDFTITTVRWSDWGDDFTKGFLEEAEKMLELM